MRLNKKIGMEFLKERKRQGLTQEEVAEKIHITKQTISKLETGKRNPTINTLEDYIVGLTGKSPTITIYSKENPFEGSYTSFEIENVKPLSEEEARLIITDDTKCGYLSFHRGCRDINALITFWKVVLKSGALNSPCFGLDVKIKILDQSQPNERCIKEFVDCIHMGRISTEISTEVNGETIFVDGNLISATLFYSKTGTVRLIFSNEYDEKKNGSIQNMIIEEEDKIAEAKQFIADNPEGFTFLCFDWPLDHIEYDESPLDITLIKAWTAEDAKEKYILARKKERINYFYIVNFVTAFAESVLSGSIDNDIDTCKNAENILKVVDELCEELFPKNESFSINSEEERRAIGFIKNKYTNDELYDIFGQEAFEHFWLIWEKSEVCARFTKDQARLVEYVYTLMTEKAEQKS